MRIIKYRAVWISLDEENRRITRPKLYDSRKVVGNLIKKFNKDKGYGGRWFIEEVEVYVDETSQSCLEEFAE